MDLTLISLDEPAETRTFAKGRFELYEVGPSSEPYVSLHVMGSEDYAA